MKMRNLILALYGIVLGGTLSYAQETESPSPKELKRAQNLTWEGNQAMEGKAYVEAEAKYRIAISANDKEGTPKYNLGNTYFEQKSYEEALRSYVKAASTTEDEFDKHRAYHNLGNVMMEKKDYAKAVEAYKSALRNDPADDESRYNLALAKKMLEKQKQDEQNDKDKNKDQKDQDKKDQDNKDQENKDQDKKDQGDQKKDDQGDQKKGEDKQDENGDPKDPGDKEENKKGDQGDQKKETPEKPKENENSPPRKSQLSPQQIKNLLEAMQNEERKSKEKMDAQKVKGVPVKSKKDW